MKTPLWVTILICIICIAIVGCTSPVEPDDKNIVDEDRIILDAKKNALKPFELHKVKSYRPIPKASESVASGLEFEYGREFINAFNNSIEDMGFCFGPDITVYTEDGKKVEVSFGFFARFIDGDNESNYFIMEPSEELLYYFNKIFENN